VRVDYTHIPQCIQPCDMNSGSAFEPGYLWVSPVLRLHLCAFWVYSVRSKNAVHRYNQKAGKSGPVAPKCKMAENLNRTDHQRPNLGVISKFSCIF